MNMDRHLKRIMTKFRYGVSELSVYYYRYRNYIEKDLKCPLCRETKKDELHFTLRCPMSDNIRRQFIPPKFCKYPRLVRLSLLMASTNQEIVRKLSNLCIRLSRLGILLLLSTNEPVVVHSYYLYNETLNIF